MERETVSNLAALKDSTTPANWAMALIVLYFVVVVGLFGFFFCMGIFAETDPDFYWEVMESTDGIENGASIISVIIYTICGICFAIWTSRVHHNLKCLDAGLYQDNTSNMAGWSYFIPFVNFYLPWKVVTENWNNLQLLVSGKASFISNNNPLVLAWWLCFIIASIIERVGGRIIDQSDPMDALTFGVIVLSIRLVAGVLAIIMIRRFIKAEKRAKDLVSNPADANIVYDALVTV